MKLALHERLELHEILTFKNICLTTATLMDGLVGCEKLKEILQTDVKEGKVHVEQLAKLIEEGEIV